MSIYIYAGVAFLIGFILAWLIRTIAVARLKKDCKSVQGRLDSERLIKETAQKENKFLLQSADAQLLTLKEKLRKSEELTRIMDADILLLQKSNEETEALLAEGEPALHDMKLRLIEATNTIARYKAQYGEK